MFVLMLRWSAGAADWRIVSAACNASGTSRDSFTCPTSPSGGTMAAGGRHFVRVDSRLAQKRLRCCRQIRVHQADARIGDDARGKHRHELPVVEDFPDSWRRSGRSRARRPEPPALLRELYRRAAAAPARAASTIAPPAPPPVLTRVLSFWGWNRRAMPKPDRPAVHATRQPSSPGA